MSDAPPEHRLMPTPISVHGVDPSLYARYYRRRVLWGSLWGLVGGAVSFTLIGLFTRAFERDTDAILGGAAIGAAASVAMLVPMFYLSYRFWQRPVALGTTYELWPDCFVRRVVGRPPLEIRKGELGAIERKRTLGGALVIESTAGETVVIPTCVAGLDRIEAELRQWPAAPAEASRQAKRRRVWAMAMGLTASASFFVVWFAPHPLWATLAFLVVAAFHGHTAWKTWRREHLDKVTRWSTPAAAIVIIVAMGIAAAVRWGQWLGLLKH